MRLSKIMRKRRNELILDNGSGGQLEMDEWHWNPAFSEVGGSVASTLTQVLKMSKSGCNRQKKRKKNGEWCVGALLS